MTRNVSLKLTSPCNFQLSSFSLQPLISPQKNSKPPSLLVQKNISLPPWKNGYHLAMDPPGFFSLSPLCSWPAGTSHSPGKTHSRILPLSNISLSLLYSKSPNKSFSWFSLLNSPKKKPKQKLFSPKDLCSPLSNGKASPSL